MGGGVTASTARVRIKGRKLSVIRFLIISIAFTIPWIIMLSQLAYYSKIFGPQVLLQLNVAFYLPSIPILLLAGHFEKLLDDQFGPTASMAIRLTVGLCGCAAISAAYPFTPNRLSYLLALVVLLGSISAVAFSASYQLVAWFRSADTIALGIGCVASGPLALIIQIALQIGTTPKRWQWIALFEVAAALVLVGLAAAWSLFWQYWNIMSGEEEYVDTSLPLLGGTAEQVEAEHMEQEADEQALVLSRLLTMQDPFQGFPFTTMPGMALPSLRPALRRALSDDMSDIRRQTHRSHVAHAFNRHGTVSRSRTAGPAVLTRKTAAMPVPSKLSATGAPSSSPEKQPAAQWLQQQGDGNAPGAANSSNAVAWFDVEQQLTAAGSGVARVSSLTSSIHSSRPASPCLIPAPANVRVGSYLEDEPDFAEFLAQQQQKRIALATSAPTTTTASLLGDEDLCDDGTALANALVTAAAKAAGTAPPADLDLPGAAAAEASSPHSSRGNRRNQQSAAAIPAPAAAAQAASQLGMEHSLQSWIVPTEKTPSLLAAAGSSSSASPAVTPTAAAAAAATAGAGPNTYSVTFADMPPPTGLLKSASQQSMKKSQSQSNLQKQQEQQQQQQQQQGGSSAAKRSLQSSFQQQQQQQQGVQQKHRHMRTASNASAVSTVSAFSAAAAGSEAAASDVASLRDLPSEPESLMAIYWEVFQYCWMVVLAALVSSTLLNCIFPFFTYVESSGLLGEFLPQVLFYTRMLSDIIGRLVPRKKALAITSPAALLALSGLLLLCSAAFFVYLQVPPRMQYDPYVLVLVLLLWLGGGYINTMGYILAPHLVPPRICTKASALMVIAYKASHIIGLCLAVGLALWLYGDIAGAL